MNEALIQTALLSLVLALSFHVGLRSGVYTFAGIGCWALGGYTTGILVTRGWPVIAAVAVSLVAAAAVGVILALLLGRLRSLYLAMATVAFTLLIQIVASSLEITGGANGLYGIPITLTTVVLAAVAVIACIVVRHGERGAGHRVLSAMRDDEQLVPALGFDMRRRQVGVFVLSSALGALAGGLYAITFGIISPSQAGFELLMSTLTMVVLGGTSSWIGPVIGAFIVTWLPEVLTFIGDWWPAVQGLIVVLFVVFAREGIVGLARAAAARTQRLRARRAHLDPAIAEQGAGE